MSLILQDRLSFLGGSIASLNIRHLDGLRLARESLINTILSRIKTDEEGNLNLPDVKTDDAIKLFISVIKAERECTGQAREIELSSNGNHPRDISEFLIKLWEEREPRTEIIGGNGGNGGIAKPEIS